MTTWRQHVAHRAYSLLLRLLGPVYLLRLWWRGRAEPMYRHAMAERLGGYDGEPSSGWVWVHAVSLGETLAAAALVDALRAQRPGMHLLLTHSTATGREAGMALLREGDRQAWFPYDATGVVKRFFKQFQPAVGVLMETEVWPNLLRAAHQNRVPMVLANARLSPRSHAKGQRLDVVMRPAARSLALVLAQSEADAQRLRDAGAPRVVVSGNLKYDLSPDPQLLERGAAWRGLPGRPVVLAAITREGEEAMLLQAWLKLAPPSPSSASPSRGRPLLLIVPRHPQRFDDVAALAAARGLSLQRRSALIDAHVTAKVLLGDSMGEMFGYYAACDLAFVGGSLLPLGGQNLIEACALGKPVLVGPHTFNFELVTQQAVDAGGALCVADAIELVSKARELLVDNAAREAMGARGAAFAAHHRGATARTVGLLRHMIF